MKELRKLNWQILREKVFGRNKRVDRLLYGEEGFPELSRRFKIVITLVVLVLMVNAGFLGYIHGYTEGTGTPPFVKTQEAVIPPDIEPATTEQVDEFLDTHDVSDEEYGIGFSCVEYGLEAARMAHWEGISAKLIGLTFADDEVGHLILGFPTTDEGWLYVEPQENVRIYPRVGGMWWDKKVIGIYYHVDGWIPIEVLEPIEGEQ